MKNFSCLFLLFFFLACKKQSADVVPSTTPTPNPFGVIVNKTDGVSLGVHTEIGVAKALAAKYVRSAIVLSQWAGSNAYYDSIIANGMKPVTNFNWGAQNTGAVPFLMAAELSNYATVMGQVLTKYQPEVVVIENEETNMNYHSGSMQQYIAMLNAAIPVAHSKGLKITNGGITGEAAYLVWQDYINTGQTAKADDYAKRTFPPSVYATLPNLGAFIQSKMKMADSLLTAYKTMDLDYLNFHWYGDPRQPNAGAYNPAVDTAHINTASLSELVDYLKRRTGKTPITNEIGEKYYSPGYVTDILQATLDLKLPCVLWYSGDGEDRFDAKGLQSGNGTLRPMGYAYKDFMSNHFK